MAKYITEYLDKQEQKVNSIRKERVVFSFQLNNFPLFFQQIKYKMDSDICNYLLTETTLTEDCKS
jgi:hypothetical protein